MLAEAHRLSLSDPVAKYYPALTRARDITLFDLGGHVSGYRDYYPLDFVDREMANPNARMRSSTNTRRARSISSRARDGRTATPIVSSSAA